jgi:hypothetical protein
MWYSSGEVDVSEHQSPPASPNGQPIENSNPGAKNEVWNLSNTLDAASKQKKWPNSPQNQT